MSQINVTKINHESGAGDNIILSADGDTQINSLNGNQLAGFRNQLINGAFTVKQFFSNGTGSNKYITDRWCTNDSTIGATATVTDVKGASRGLKLEGGSRIIRQLVELPLNNENEASAGQFYNGSQWTMSIYSTVAPDQLSVGFCDGGVVAGTLIPVTGIPAWTATSDVQGAYTRYSCTFAINVNPVNTNRAIRVSWSFSSEAIFTLAQLESGPVATPFEHRMGELALCQRYYYQLPAGVLLPMYNPTENSAVNSSTGQRVGYVTHPVTLRVAPTVTGSVAGAAETLGTPTVYGCEITTGRQGATVMTRINGYTADAEL